jgi:hypothetical protein
MGFRIRQEVTAKAVKESVPRLNIPTWVIRDLGFKPGDRGEWVPLTDDKGEKMVALRKIPKKKEEEGDEKKGEKEEEGGEDKTD